MRRSWLIAPLLLAVIVSSASAAGDGENAIRLRQPKFRTLVKLHRAVKAELMRPNPDAVLIARLAGEEAELVRPLVTWFPNGSGPGGGEETYAMPEIWTHPQDFAAKASALEAALGRLGTAARQGAPDSIRAAQQSVAAACQACHDDYLNR